MKKRMVVAAALAGMMLLTSCKATTKTPTNTAAAKLAGTVSAADTTKSPAQANSRSDTFVVGNTQMSGVWNKEYSSNSYDWYVCDVMFDYLVTPTPDGKAMDNAATYTISKDAKTFTFKIKKDVKYWDGNAATADDVVWYLTYLADPNYDGQVDLSSLNIEGYDAYHKGSATSISGVKALDKNTVQITLTQPNAAGLWNLNMPLIEKAYYAPNFKKGDAKEVSAEWAKKAPMGTGAYKFVSYSAATGAKLTANDNYFNGKPKIANLEFAVVPEGQELQSVQTGQTDFDNATCSDDDVAAVKKASFINAYYYPTNGFGMVQWNLTEDKFKDVRVRQALAYGLNRAAVIKSVYGPYGLQNDVPLPMASWGYTSDAKNGITTYDFNLAKAKQLLNDAGWTLNPNTNQLEKDGKAFTIDFTATSGNPVTDVMLPEMKQDYAKLGIKVNVETADFATLLKGYYAATLDATFLGNGLSTPDPDTSVQFMTGQGQNYYKYSNTALDTLYKDELTETNQSKRTQLFYQIDKILNNDLPVFTIYQRNDMYVVNSRIGNIPTMGAFRDPQLDFYKYTIKK